MKNYMILLLLVSMSIMISCSKKVAFERSDIVPAAEADIKVKTDKNGNYEMEISVENLAHPQNLNPAKKTYVVWMESKDYRVYNLGELKVSDNLKGSLTAVTPHEPDKVFITAEDNSSENRPSNHIVLTSSRF